MSVERLAERMTGAMTGNSSGMKIRTVDIVFTRFAHEKIESVQLILEISVQSFPTEYSASP